MQIANKIITDIDKLRDYAESLKAENKKISLCHGHFNVIHPGHLRFLEYAKKNSDILIVAIWGDDKIDRDVADKFYKTDIRARGVASLEFVNKVFIFSGIDIIQLLETVKPQKLVMGEEFSNRLNELKNEIGTVEKHGGKVVFSSGDSSILSSAELLDRSVSDIKLDRLSAFLNILSKYNITVNRLNEIIDNFKKVRLLVVGDTIVDSYVACDAMGMSSEAPVIVLKEIDHKEYVGGAAVVARHANSFGCECCFVSVVGNDFNSGLVRNSLSEEGIKFRLISDDQRPTTFKIRYMAGPQKLLRVSRLVEQHIDQEKEKEIIDYIESSIDNLDGIIVSDFSYGILTPAILDYISALALKNKLKIFGDSQTSSQIGDILKFMNYFLIKPTEKEARIALDDKYNGLEKLGNDLVKKTGVKNAVISLGPEGFISFMPTENDRFIKTQHFPALNPYPIDVVGAGDSMLASFAVSSCAGADLIEASAISAVVSSIAVGKMGNVPVSISEIKEFLKDL